VLRLDDQSSRATKRRPRAAPDQIPRVMPMGWDQLGRFVGDHETAVCTWETFGRVRQAAGVQAATTAVLTVAYRVAHGHPIRRSGAGWVGELARCYRDRCRIEAPHGTCGQQALIVHRGRWLDWLADQHRDRHRRSIARPLPASPAGDRDVCVHVLADLGDELLCVRCKMSRTFSPTVKAAPSGDFGGSSEKAPAQSRATAFFRGVVNQTPDESGASARSDVDELCGEVGDAAAGSAAHLVESRSLVDRFGVR
jgi:hypothetical protein